MLVVITIGLFLYVFFVQKAEEQRPTVSESSFEISDSSSVSSFLPAEEGSLPPTDISEDTTDVRSTSSPETSFSDVFAPESHLTQLSTLRVAGMVFTGTSTVRFSERGTGEITDLDVLTMNTESIETNLSGVIAATFNANGSRVILKINDNLSLRFFAGVIAENARGEKELRGSFLPNNTQDAIFAGITNIRYLLTKSNGGEIHTFEPSTRTDTIEATIPFTQAHFITSTTGVTYLITTPSAHMEGSIYQYTPAGITAFALGGQGLTAFAAGNTVFITAYRNKILSTIATNGISETNIQNILNTDTCIAAPITIYCARPFEIPTTEYPDRWYRGEEHHNDMLFELDRKENKLFSLINPESETGQSFDILKLVAHPTRDDLLLLINKNNDTLWLYAR